MEQLREAFARETDAEKQKAIAEQVQQRHAEIVTHIHLGQWYGAAAVRKNVDGMIEAPVTVFWNVEKKGR
jgi:peptide/nickel transport system substrate-binding protein